MDLRSLTKAELQGKPNGEYVIGIDVARSENESNNKCCASILKIIRNKQERIKTIQLVNMIDIPATQNFKLQAQEVLKLKNLYDAKALCIDVNGVGTGILDELLQEQVDVSTGENLGCLNTMNTEQESEDPTAPECIYALKSQGINHEVIVNFINMVDGEKLQLLEKRTMNDYDEKDLNFIEKEVVPFAKTDALLEELANLKLKQLPSGKFTIEQQTRKIDKDRYSALAYGLWYIKEYEDDFSGGNADFKASDFLLIN